MTVDELFPVDGKYTLGSLFDGAGGFPLAAQMCGIKPVWASEIEPFPIAVTKARFPNMKHLGDVTKINGAEIEPVDIISFGSPCQNLSVAGNGKGLSGEQSGLFLEAIRIIKEMREATNGKKPRMAIWENVMGAFTTNGGGDFGQVLTEFCNIKQPTAYIEQPKSKWAYSGCIVGDGFSLAWRSLNAQHWGVPQRRRRIFLVASFDDERAPEILFKRKGLCRNFAALRNAWQTTSRDTAGGADGKSCERTFGFYPQLKAEAVTLLENVMPTLVNGTNYGYQNGVVQVKESETEMYPFSKVHRSASADDATTWVDGKVANTLNTFDHGESRANELVVFSQDGTPTTYGIGSAQANSEICENVSLTLHTLNDHALVCCPSTIKIRSGKDGGEKVLWCRATNRRHLPSITTKQCSFRRLNPMFVHSTERLSTRGRTRNSPQILTRVISLKR